VKNKYNTFLVFLKKKIEVVRKRNIIIFLKSKEINSYVIINVDFFYRKSVKIITIDKFIRALDLLDTKKQETLIFFKKIIKEEINTI